MTEKEKDPFKVTIIFAGKKYTRSIEADAGIDQENINDELTKQPSLFAWYATMTHHANVKVESIKRDQRRLKRATAQFEIALRAKIRAAAKGELKLTEKALEEAVYETDEYKALLKKAEELDDDLVYAEAEQGHLSSGRDSMYTRTSILISLANTLRAQVDGDLGKVADRIAQRQRDRGGR